MMQQDLEGLAAQRALSWEVEINHRKLLSQIPHRSPFWLHRLDDGMVLVGTWLTSWGKWLVQRDRIQGVTVACK
jgi:hypothetical protein